MSTWAGHLTDDDTLRAKYIDRDLTGWTRDRYALANLLDELCPDGLTDDCPARKDQPESHG